MTVAALAEQLGLWPQVCRAVEQQLSAGQAAALLEVLAPLPVRKSGATRSLGSYSSRNGQPSAVRLQFAQSPRMLAETLLHELAHAIDHLTNQPGERYRRAHGPGWQRWARALGIEATRTGHCPQLAELHRQRLKLVAVCRRCGTEFRRTRRLPRGRRYLHPGCGGQVVPLP